MATFQRVPPGSRRPHHVLLQGQPSPAVRQGNQRIDAMKSIRVGKLPGTAITFARSRAILPTRLLRGPRGQRAGTPCRVLRGCDAGALPTLPGEPWRPTNPAPHLIRVAVSKYLQFGRTNSIFPMKTTRASRSAPALTAYGPAALPQWRPRAFRASPACPRGGCGRRARARRGWRS
jgi:hypothetical protein